MPSFGKLGITLIAFEIASKRESTPLAIATVRITLGKREEDNVGCNEVIKRAGCAQQKCRIIRILEYVALRDSVHKCPWAPADFSLTQRTPAARGGRVATPGKDSLTCEMISALHILRQPIKSAMHAASLTNLLPSYEACVVRIRIGCCPSQSQASHGRMQRSATPSTKLSCSITSFC